MIDFFHIWRAQNQDALHGDYLKWLAQQWADYVEARSLGDMEMAEGLNDPLRYHYFRKYLCESNVPERHVVTVEVAIAKAAKIFDLAPEDIVSPRKYASLLQARFAIVWAVRRLRPDLSYPMIGVRLGGRDHSTVMWSETRAGELRARDAEFRQMSDALLAELQALMAERQEAA